MDPDSESTVTSLEEENTENFCDNPTRDILADGIISMFKPTVDQLQERVRATRASQQDLKLMLDTLSLKLKAIEQSQQTPAILADYVRKLVNVKHKVTVVFNVLTTAQERLNKMHHQIEIEKNKTKTLLDSDSILAAVPSTSAGIT